MPQLRMLSIKKAACSLKRLWDTTAESTVEEPAAKKRREDKDPDYWTPSPRFWDSLPKIWLTRRALDEFDRRVSEDASQKEKQQEVKQQEKEQHKEEPVLHLSNLQRFARHGGPDLTALRGFPDPTMSNPSRRPTKLSTSSGRTQRSTPYDANYESKLNQAGIFLTPQIDLNNNDVKPSNYEEIMARLTKRRPSLSPSRFTEQDYRNFELRARSARDEASVVDELIPIIEGQGQRQQYDFARGLLFNNIKPFNSDIAMAKPDRYDGTLQNIDHRVLHRLGDLITPSTDLSRPAVPNFFLECKGPGGPFNVAERQAAHYGAIGARAMVNLQNYPAQTPYYDGNAYSFTNILYGKTLCLFTVHATAPDTPNGPPHYYLTQIESCFVDKGSDEFRKAATYYRNARDIAKDYREAFIYDANKAAAQMPVANRSNHSCTTMNTLSSKRADTQSQQDAISLDTDTSTDELALDEPAKRSRQDAPSPDIDTSADELALDEPVKHSRRVQLTNNDTSQTTYTMSSPVHNQGNPTSRKRGTPQGRGTKRARSRKGAR